MHPNICNNCNYPFVGNYCNHCGQKKHTEHDKKLSVILDETLHFLTHFEGKFFTTFITLLTKPGKLSTDYCNGIRQRYYKPMSFFLMVIILYLLFPFMEGLNMRLEYYKGIDFMEEHITQQIADKVNSMSISEKELGEIFKQKSEKMAKVLLLVLVPLVAFGLYLLHLNSRKSAYDFFILAIEINIFVILNFFLLIPIIVGLILFILRIGNITEAILMPVYLVISLTALTMMFRRFFGELWIVALLKSVLFLFLYYVITQVIYKTLLFKITFELI